MRAPETVLPCPALPCAALHLPCAALRCSRPPWPLTRGDCELDFGGRFDSSLHEIRTRVRRMGARLVHRWVRVKADVLGDVAALLAEWRGRSNHLLGVHLRGTDKVTHPKIPLEKFVRYIDLYMTAHPGALIVLATDDASYHAQLTARYPGNVVGASSGYNTRNVVRDRTINGYAKGRSGLVDALLLAHTDYLLKGTSSLAEFSLWYNPSLIERHLDLQICCEGERSPAYQALIPRWANGEYEPPPLPPTETPEAKLLALQVAAGVAPPSASDSSASDAKGDPEGARLPPAAKRLEAAVIAASARRSVFGSVSGDNVSISRRRRGRRGRRSEREAAAGENAVPAWPLPAHVPSAVQRL